MEKENPKTGALLLVDDNKGDQNIIKEAFVTLGISNELITVENGIEALEYLRSGEIQPILILCDVNMPLMDGLKLKEEIFNDQTLKKKKYSFYFYFQ